MTDKNIAATEAMKSIVETVRRAGVKSIIVDNVPPEPEVKEVGQIYLQAKEFSPEIIVAVGGGSVLDTAKFLSAMLTNPSYAKDITDTSTFTVSPVPVVMLPTSAGTGAEATQNAIIFVEEKRLKVGVVHTSFIPSHVLLDPELTITMPPSVTASTGIDAFCHAIECLISKKGNPFSQAFALRAIHLISKYLPRACRDGADLEAREQMLLASFYAGICINTASTVAVHALSYPLGGAYRIPHGVANAMLLIPVMRFNADAVIPELALAADAMGLDVGTEQEAKVAALKAMEGLVREVKIPVDLTAYGVHESEIGVLADAALEVRRLLDQNPKAMTRDDIIDIYKTLFPKQD